MQISTPTTSRLESIPDGPRGTRVTLDYMRAFAREGKTALPVRMLALRLVRHLPQKDWAGQVRVIHAFVRDKIRYVKDVRGVETLQTPEKTLEIGQGDCDDKSTLTAALLESIGHPTRFIAVGFAPGSFSHVLVETKIGSKWVPLETTEPVPVGWFPRGVVTRMRVNN